MVDTHQPSHTSHAHQPQSQVTRHNVCSSRKVYEMTNNYLGHSSSTIIACGAVKTSMKTRQSIIAIDSRCLRSERQLVVGCKRLVPRSHLRAALFVQHQAALDQPLRTE